MSANRPPFVLAALLALAACATDPMNAADGISPAAGLAQRQNSLILAVDPLAGDRPAANPGGSGPRAAGVIDRYQAGAPQAGETAEDGGEATAE